MRAGARIAALRCAGLLAAFLLAPALAEATDPGPAASAGPWATLELKGGRVLHNAKVMSDEGDSLVIRSDEGLVKVAKVDLPQAAVQAYPSKAPETPSADMVMRPFNPDLPPAAPEPTPKLKPAPEQAPKAKPAPNPVFRGCTISSFQAKPFQNSLGTAEVVIENGTQAPAVVFPGDLVCVTATGARHRGRQIIMDGFPPVVRRRQVVPAQGSVDVLVAFTSEALDISSVQWAN